MTGWRHLKHVALAAWGRVAIVFPIVAILGASALLLTARRAQPVHEVSDGAAIEMSVLQALEGRQLLGPYSRFGWHHPGPIFFYWTAPWYRLSGDRTAGAQAGALALNLLVLLVSVAIAVRWTGWPMAAAIATALLAFMWQAHEGLASVWNPHVAVMPLLGLVVSASVVLSGGGAVALLWCACLASFAAQTHIALAPVSAVMLALACLGAIRRPADPHRTWGIAGAVLALLAVLWLPPILEQLMNTPGNMTRIWQYFFAGAHPGQPSWAAMSVWAAMLTAPLTGGPGVPWGAPLSVSGTASSVMFATVEIGALVVVLWKGRRTNRGEAALAALCLVASAVAFWAVTRIDPPVMDHDVFWIAGLGVLQAAVAVGGVASLRTAAAGGRLQTRAAAPVIVVIFAAGCLALAVYEMRAILARPADAPDDRAITAVTEGVRRTLADERMGTLRIEVDDPVWPIAAGVLLQLTKAGVPYALEDRWVGMFGERLRATGRETMTVTIAGPDLHAVLAARPRNRTIASEGLVFADALPSAP